VESEDAGAVVKSTGDGVLAVFAEPSSGVERALKVQEMTRHDRTFAIRVGIDMGQVSVHWKGGIVADVFGRHVNRAARIMSMAKPGHVLVSYQVYDCAIGWLRSPRLQWRDLGEMQLKGFGESVSIFEAFDPTATSPQDADTQAVAVLSVSLGGFSSVYEEEEDQLRRMLYLVKRAVPRYGGAAAERGVTSRTILVPLSNAADAVEAALEIQRAAAEVALSPRIGIALGEAGDIRSSPGPAANMAVRLGRLAEPGGIVASGDAYRTALVTMALDAHDLGVVQTQGVKDSLSAFVIQRGSRRSEEAETGRSGVPSSIPGSTAMAPLSRLQDELRTGTSLLRSRSTAWSLGAWKRLLSGGAPRVLWVDDHPENNALMVDVLARAGWKVDQVLDTDHALGRLRWRYYSVVITDMGRGSRETAGLDLLQAMRARSVRVPTIVYTSTSAGSRHGQAARDLGAVQVTSGGLSLLRDVLAALKGRLNPVSDA
jgi:class 3 adenylate cyclase